MDDEAAPVDGLTRSLTMLVTHRGGVTVEMMQVSVAELQARLSEYLALVQTGEEIVVTDRGRPVARLISPVTVGASGDEQRLLDLQRIVLLRIGSGVRPDDFWELERPEDAQATLRAALEPERSEGY